MEDFIAGCIGGCAGLVVGHPFDTVKVHMQTQNVKNPKYSGTFHCIRSIIAKDSIRGLYRGISSPIAGVSVINGIVFGAYGNVQRLSSNPDTFKSHFIAGSAAGLIQSLICSPMELAKTQLQVQSDRRGANKLFRGPSECLSFIYRNHGIRGVFKGLTATALRDVPGFAAYFVSYEYFMHLKRNPGISYTLLAGGMAGMCSWILTIPIDVVKSRLQVDGMTGDRQYNGMIDCFRQSYKSEGMSFFTRGLSSTLLRAFPMNAVCFLVVSLTLKYGNDLLLPGKWILPDWNHKRRVIQSLLYLEAFNEAICPSEIMELAYDWYDNNKFHYSNNRINFHPNNEFYLRSVKC